MFVATVLLAVACGDDDDLSSARVSSDPTATTVVAIETSVNEHDPGTPCPTVKAGRASVVATPGLSINVAKSYEAIVKTNKGDVRLTLFDDQAPGTVNNFVHLARCGYYDDSTWHRVIANFMVQGGDPTGTGSAGPGYSIPDEYSADLGHDGPGVLSMANSGANTGGSQFFITHKATPHLDGTNPDGSPKDCEGPGVSCHAVFGTVIDGQVVINSLSITDAGVTPDQIKTIEIIEN